LKKEGQIMKKIITETKNVTINICDYKDCEEEIKLYRNVLCDCCKNNFCEKHLKEKKCIGVRNYWYLCDYCYGIYDEIIYPHKEKIEKNGKKIDAMNREQQAIWKIIHQKCQENYDKMLKDGE
jgi:hypothetical protein